MGKKRAPEFLKSDTKRWFNEICKTYELQSHHLKLLVIACQAWDRLTEARESLKRDGLFTKDRYGTLKANPACKIENDSMTQFIKAVRELGFDIDRPADTHRPPRLY